MTEKIAVVGLGYVGLPVAVAIAKQHPGTVGFDISEKRVQALQSNQDATGEVDANELEASSLIFTTDPTQLEDCTFYIVAVPTPIDHDRRPDLGPLISASKAVGKTLKKGDVVVYESTVYPGVTEEVCGPILAEASGLRQSSDFKLGYSPERINPGDKEHTFEKIIKVVSGEDEQTLERVAALYSSVVRAGVHRAPTIKVAEAAKVIENTQRDLNIALMNELALIFDRLDIPTRDVLEAAATKWNFVPFTPGLVGGHCIGVDPYYLTAKAEALGYHPEVILSGRRINDGMGAFVAQKVLKLLAVQGPVQTQARVGVLGLTFKENVPDLRNSKVPDIVNELQEYGVQALVHDPFADAQQAKQRYGIELVGRETMRDLDALVLAVPHRPYLEDPSSLSEHLREGGLLVDVRSALQRDTLPASVRYWCL